MNTAIHGRPMLTGEVFLTPIGNNEQGILQASVHLEADVQLEMGGDGETPGG